MELYLDLLSPPCRAVFLFAKTLKIPFDFKHVELAEGQQYSEEFAKLSIVKKVPVLKDGDFVLTESTAILKYLARKCLVADHWFPADLRQQALVNEYSSWQHLNLRSHCSKVFLFKTLFPAIMGSEVSKEKMDIALEDLRHSLDLLEEKFLKDKLFLVSNKISLADVVAVVEVMQPFAVALDVLEGRPKLSAWRDRVKKELGEKLFQEAHERILDSKSLQQKMQNNSSLEKLKPKYEKLFR
ncbi:Glutathione S-transferase theta-1 [Oryzias melastigma]|uniref:glutathione transferase n=1 Tax=Oryzias melastigma TaxID=30732 RepID=A0A3B3BV77_ORYME|nr:glutathione S-transferase theta-1a [Oryzias melastigma]KAF6733667.1 Glutathione S-transferase theta-1 [Oryzias melastigma]